jgi:pyruvate dehydrogenase E2 component (dihydrolipoamide acetyltransferase)
MAIEVRLPQWGMGMQEGTVVRWLKREKDSVEAGEELVEIEAAKVTEVVSAPVSGILTHILVSEGQTIPVRTVLCTIRALDEVEPETEKPSLYDQIEKTAAPSAPRSASAPPQGSRPPRVQVTPVARRVAQEHGLDLSQIQGTGPGGRIIEEDVRRIIEAKATPPAPARTVQIEPRARRLAQEHGLDLSQIQGSGPGERITEADVRQAIEVVAAEAQVVPLTGMRGTIARRMHDSLQGMAQVTLTTEADVTELVKHRETLKLEFDLTYTDLVIKAVTLALPEHPRLNAWVEEEAIRLLPDIHIGLAVALEDGLIVPVIQNADQKSLKGIAQESQRLARRAREGLLIPAAVTGSTFTVTNLGMYGVDTFTPIINPPEVAILGIGRIVEKPSRRNGELLWRQAMALNLTFDHRAVDGAPAALFLQAVKNRLERPDWLSS